MKIAIVLFLLVAVVAVQDSDAWFVRSVVRSVVRAVRNVIRGVRRVTRAVWRNARKCWRAIIRIGKRDNNSLDLNKDGHVDLKELGKILGEREARDLMEAMSGSTDPVPVEEFKRNVRDLTELSEEDLYNQVEELSKKE
ncbi:uncharacterized protein LOC121378134 [Gigantopelta aegis]|uniref:uncharacterized protein LOC121378134 n=1 Tax=Gigantopelta aegis TaxID=1735272 RepID=UPI001B88BB9D|nr:uncharacterized protein LOC121378134 [Gigantopelta aegis]